MAPRAASIAASSLIASSLSALAGNTTALAEVRAGFASRDVSTRASIPMGGYGVYVGVPRQTRQSRGVHDPLFASAAAFEGGDGRGVLVVGVDSVGLTAASTRRVREFIGTRVPQASFPLLIAASHSHHTPDGMGLWGALPFFTGRDAAYMRLIESGIAEAAVSAWNARVPVTLSRAVSKVANSTSGAADPRGRHDQAITLVARDATGRTTGTLTQWSAHPTVLPAGNKMLSADYIGSYRAFLSTRYEGVHVYVNGALGNAYPSDTGARPADPFPGGDRSPEAGESYEKAAGVGQALADAVAGAIAAATPMVSETYTLASTPVRFRLRNALFELANGLRIIETKLLPGKRVDTEVSLVRFGDVTALAVPAELFPAAAAELEATLPAPTVGERHAIIGMANDWLGYVMTEAEMRDPALSYNRALSPGSEALPAFRGAFEGLSR